MKIIRKQFQLKGALSAFVIMTAMIISAGEETRQFYRHSTWQPRISLTAEEVLRGDFFPPSPPVKVNYNDPDFDDSRLHSPPAPGVHPRVLLTPQDAEMIRGKIALGEKAPVPFRAIWERVSKDKGALYAYLMKDDKLGKVLAESLMKKVKALGPKLDAMEKYPDHENLWSVERSMQASGDPNVPNEIWQLADYDLLYGWLSESDRELARKTIARVTANRVSNFINVPDHYMVNNHEGFGMAFIPLLLSIEGEEGFDPVVYKRCVQKLRAMLDYYLTKDGMCYETIKGWLNNSALVAIARREKDLLKHSHLRAKMDFFIAALRWEMPNLARPRAWTSPEGQNAGWLIRDEMRASAFHVIWMMYYFHPQVLKYDFLYQATLSSHDFLTDSKARWPNPVGVDYELLLLFAVDPKKDSAGKNLNWTDQKLIDSLKLPVTWKDDQRGYLEARNSWRKDDVHLGFACKQEYFYGGHEGSEHGRFTLWADGVNWALDNNSLFYKGASLHNQITVDGLGIHWPPVAGEWLGVSEGKAGVTASGDYKDGYSFYKSTQIHPLDFPSGKIPYYARFTAGNLTLTRDIQIAFHDEMLKFYDGYAHTDYGTWSGEARLLDGYRPWNPMEQAYRTVQLTRGKHPYVMVIDNVKKDDQTHEFAWNMVLPDDVQLLQTANFVNFTACVTPEEDDSVMDLFLGRIDIPRNNAKYFWEPLFKPRKGDPALLVRVLKRKTNQGFTVPRTERIDRFNVLVIPANTVSPEFMVMLFPFRWGETLPKTEWNHDQSRLTVSIGDQVDTYNFGKTDGRRTVFSLARDNKILENSDAPPAAPVLLVNNQKYDMSDARYTREENRIKTYLFQDEINVGFLKPAMDTKVYYTLDGSEPTSASRLFSEGFNIDKTCTLKAKVIDPEWSCGPGESRTLSANFVKRNPVAGLKVTPEIKQGILARVYELKTVNWDDKGFFDSRKVMMPDLNKETPVLTNIVSGFVLPHVEPKAPYDEQRKGFYRFNGLFNAPETGVYEFSVNSCGPVSLDFGNQTVIEHTGQFHQQQKVRKGEAVLAAGWHEFELVVTDPLFWKINTDNPMPFSVEWSINGKKPEAFLPEQLALVNGKQVQTDPAAQPLDIAPLKNLPALEPGLEKSEFDRSNIYQAYRPVPTEWLDIENISPLQTEKTEEIITNTGDSLVVSYDGYFMAPAKGVYTFDLPARMHDSIDCNQLRINDKIIVQRGVPGRNPLRKVLLQPGYYAISIRLGKSRDSAEVTYPDGRTEKLMAKGLFRPVRPVILPEGIDAASASFELFSPANVRISLPEKLSSYTIRYTLDGSLPNESSPAYNKPIAVDHSMVISAAGFDGRKITTAPSKVAFDVVSIPKAGLICAADPENLKTGKLPVPGGGFVEVWLSPDSNLTEKDQNAFLVLHGGSIVKEKEKSLADRKVDANLDKGNGGAGIKLLGLKFPRNDLSISLWFRVPDIKEGKLFGKWGFNSIGKAYQAVNCQIRNGRIEVDPGRLRGGKISPNTWHHLAVCRNKSDMTCFLDGEKIAEGEASSPLVMDALDFAVDMPVDIKDLRIYSRSLKQDDIHKLSANKEN